MWAARSDDIPSRGGAAEPAPELVVVINPGSGEHDVQATRDTLARIFGAQGRAFRFVDVASGSQLASAADAAAVQAAGTGAVLVAVGGDGTINAVAQAAWRHGCPLGVLPQGTFNYFGRDHGIAQELEQAATALLNAQAGPVQVGEVNGRLFLVNASLGLYPQLLQDRETYKQQLGRHRWVAVFAGLVTVFKWRRQLALEIELDGQRTRVLTPTLFIGNNRLQLQQIGMEAEIANRVGEGRLAGLMPRPIGSWRLLLLALRGALGRLAHADEIQGAAFRTLTVKVRGARRVKVAADGEVEMLVPPLQFRVADRPLLLMQPRPEDRVAVA
jgi:diacylglycerol kinase family enzyme